MKKFLISVLCVITLFMLMSCTQPKDRNISKITVSGNSLVDLKPDMVRFYIRVSETKDSTKEAQIATNDKISTILEILKKYNVKDQDIKTQDLDISTQYHWIDGKQERVGESVSQSLKVTVNNIDNFTTIIDSLGSVSGISVYSVSFDASDKNKASEQARILAFEDAKDKALVYCKASGMKLGKAISINETYATYNARTVYNDIMTEESAPMPMMKAYAGGASEIPSGNISVKVNIECEFEIK